MSGLGLPRPPTSNACGLSTIKSFGQASNAKLLVSDCHDRVAGVCVSIMSMSTSSSSVACSSSGTSEWSESESAPVTDTVFARLCRMFSHVAA